MGNLLFVCVGLLCLMCAVLIVHLHRRSLRRAHRIVSGMDELLRSNGALVMVSKVGDVAVVGVVADWTGFSEQSFFDYSIESAIEEAVRACGECKREFDYLKG